MAESAYSFSLTTFSPSGKLVQIEYALNAVASGATSLGVKARNGVVIATEKKLPSVLIDEGSVQKILMLTENIAIVLCNGSRDHTICSPLCCRVGCMYSAKHAQLVMGALPLADVTIYYIDIRAFGKGYDEFYEQSKGMGVQYTKGKVARIDEEENGNLQVYYEDMESDGGMKKAEHDLVVLTVGFLPNLESLKLYKGGEVETDEFAYIREPDASAEPSRTNIDGLFAAGTVIGARDIPDTVLHACASSAQAAGYIQKLRNA